MLKALSNIKEKTGDLKIVTSCSKGKNNISYDANMILFATRFII